MQYPFSKSQLSKIFKKSSKNENLIGTNEGVTVEYKETFGWKSLSEYLKAMASFANRDGGYIIYGVKDKPHVLKGLYKDSLERFEEIDNQEWTTNLREYFAPEIIWEKDTYIFEEKTYGIIYTYPAKNKPIICKKNGDTIKKAAIYYRYNSQSTEIDYPELHEIIENEINKINDQWMKTIRQIGDSGITRTAILDLKSGKMTGVNTSLYMDESLLDDISFVQEGSFVETGGNPALKVVGQVETVVGANKVIVEREHNKAINSDEIIKCFIVHDKVSEPLEFVKQICYQNTGYMPVYYYLRLAGISNSDALSYLEDVPINSRAKDILTRRIEKQEVKLSRLNNINSEASKKKKKYAQLILDNELILPNDEKELKYCLQAIRSLEKEQIKERQDELLNILYELYSTYFNEKPFSSIKSEFRFALCWIDEALYMEK